jgi:hypothetical protein
MKLKKTYLSDGSISLLIILIQMLQLLWKQSVVQVIAAHLPILQLEENSLLRVMPQIKHKLKSFSLRIFNPYE